MDFNLFIYCTAGRRAELEAGMAGQKHELYQRMLDEIADYATFADDNGYAGFGHPEHHLQLEGFEISNDPTLMAMWLGQHTKRLRVITCGFVSTTHNPLRAAEAITTLDHMLKGRFGVGFVRGYQARWVENFKIRSDLSAVGPWNKNTDVDDYNRDYFTEWVDVVTTALTNKTFSYQGKFWQFPPADFVNPHEHGVYSQFGAGVDPAMRISEVGVAPRPYQSPHPPFYGGFTGSMRTAIFWAKYGGTPIVMADSMEFCEALWGSYREESLRLERQVAPGSEAAWGGLMVCAPTDAEAQRQFEDMRWFWERWSIPFGNGFPPLLVGSPDTISRKLEAARDTINPRETFLIFPQGIHEKNQVLDSLGLFSSAVMPRFQ